ncbi:MAG: TonB-dependent receptor, partial [Acidobacteriota bacterium]
MAFLYPGLVGADGTQTGLIAGAVTDADDHPVPGVQIRLDGPGGQRSAVSDSVGRYRFPSLRPGIYRLRASLLSLSAEANDVAVYIGRTTPVDLLLAEAETLDDGAPNEVLPGPSESVQVVALAPLVDPLDTRVRSVVRREFLDVLPVERFYQSVALLLPDVAGGGDGNPNVGGALRSNNLFLVDGVDTTDPVTGLFGLNLAYEAVESVEVSTAGLPAEHGRVSGSVINVVTRSSGDEHRGSAYWLLEPTKGDVRSRPGPDHLTAEIAAANSGDDDDQTVSATLGGPLSSDGGAWYFIGGNESDSTAMQPTLIGELWDGGVSIDAGVARLGWRFADSQTIELQYTLDSASSLAFSPLLINAENTVSKPPTSAFTALTVPTPGNLAAVSLLEQSGSFAKLDWGAVLGPAWTLNARVSTQDRELERSPATRVGITGNATHADITSLEEGSLDIFDEVAFWNGISDVGRELRPRRQVNLAAGWFGSRGRVDHDLRVGVDFQDTESETDLRVSGTPGFDRETGQPVAGQFFFDLGLDDECIDGGPCSSFDPVAGTFGPFFFLNMPVRPAVVSESTQSA